MFQPKKAALPTMTVGNTMEATNLASSALSPHQQISSSTTVSAVEAAEQEVVESSNLLSPLSSSVHQTSEFILTSSPLPVRASSCMKCKGSGIPLSKSSIDATYETIAQIQRNIQRGELPASLAPHARQRSSLEDVVTCANCVHRGSNGKSPSKYCCGEWCKDYWGIMLSIANGLASTLGAIIVRYKEDFHPFSLAAYKFQGIVLPTLLIILYYYFFKNQNVFQSIWPLNDKDKLMKFGFTIIRAVIGCLGLYLFFYAVKLLPLADVKAIMSCRTIFVLFLAHIFLGEPCGVFPVFAALFSMIGVGIIAKPPLLTGDETFDTDKLMGVLFSILAMLTVTLSLVVLRYLRGVHVAVVTLAFGFWGTILSIACSATVERFDVPQTTKDWVLMFCLAFSAFCSQISISLAMKFEDAGAVVVLTTIDTLMSFVLQYLILDIAPDRFSVLGAIIIVVCVSLITMRKWVRTLPEKHSRRKAFWFILK